MKKRMKNAFQMKADGIGVIEIILILVIIIGLVLIFREQITGLVKSIFETISGGVGEVQQPITIN